MTPSTTSAEAQGCRGGYADIPILAESTRLHLQALDLPCAQLQHHSVLLQLLLPPPSQLVQPCQLCLQGLAATLGSRLTA